MQAYVIMLSSFLSVLPDHWDKPTGPSSLPTSFPPALFVSSAPIILLNWLHLPKFPAPKSRSFFQFCNLSVDRLKLPLFFVRKFHFRRLILFPVFCRCFSPFFVSSLPIFVSGSVTLFWIGKGENVERKVDYNRANLFVPVPHFSDVIQYNHKLL